MDGQTSLLSTPYSPWEEPEDYINSAAMPQEYNRDDSIVIAPWLAPPQTEDHAPAPAHHSARRMFSFTTHPRKQGSQMNLRARGDSDASQTDRPYLDRDPHKDGKKSFLNFIKRKASRPAFAKDEERDRFGTHSTASSFDNVSLSGSLSAISVNGYNYGGSTSALPTSFTSSSLHLPSTSSSKRTRKYSRNKSSTAAPEESDPNLTLDTNLGNMDGIVDTARINGTYNSPTEGFAVSPWDATPFPSSLYAYGTSGGVNPSAPSLSRGSSHASHTSNNPFITTDPFNPASNPVRRTKPRVPPPLHLSVSPKTTMPLDPVQYHSHANAYRPPQSSSHAPSEKAPESPGGLAGWVAPASWATVPAQGGNSSDEDDFGQEIKRDRGGRSSPPHGLHPHHLDAAHVGLYEGSIVRKGSSAVSPGLGSPRTIRERSLPLPPNSAGVDSMMMRPREKPPQSSIRIYRTDGKWHVVTCPIQTTVGDMRAALTKRLGIRGTGHRLYLRERGRERALGSREEPALLLRRRLEQAGYDSVDDLENLGGEDLSFLLRFVFRNASLATVDADDEAITSGFEHIELAERSLETVPIVLHLHASSIITLNLSKNPLIDIPSDFAQVCTSLRELRLSHVSIKRVSNSIREILSLQWLDISCNRIADLETAGLEKIPGLRQVFVQNNRLSTLPASFSQITSLKYLNISNNKFEEIPPVICDMTSLVDLDVSFNSIELFPPRMGQLVNLERLIIVGNRITMFPPESRHMTALRELDCRRNLIEDLSPLSALRSLESLFADHNQVRHMDFAIGSRLHSLAISHNPITKIHLRPLAPDVHYHLHTLDLSNMKLSGLDDDVAAFAASAFTSLVVIKLDYNKFRILPDAICTLTQLEVISCTNNELESIPENIGQLQKLRILSVHNNNIKAIPASMWECGQLVELNASSNLLEKWEDPSLDLLTSTQDTTPDPPPSDQRKGSAAGLSITSRTIPPLAASLQHLLLADNRLGPGRNGFDIFRPLAMMRELRVLNLSFNELNELPPLHLQTFAQLQELYLSGNNLTSLPREEMHKLSKLKVLHLNGNKLQTLPAELRKVSQLETLDVGNNQLKYNIANWQYDWNWNFNSELKYLNLSGNKRLEIKKGQMQSLAGGAISSANSAPPLFDFANLTKLRVLGLMDVTLVIPTVPDDTLTRRVRTSETEINGMAYGIADTLGKVDGPTTFDLVLPNFRKSPSECLFGMFGRTQPVASSNRAAKYLSENFAKGLNDALVKARERNGPDAKENFSDAMRSAFLALNRGLYAHLDPKLSTSTVKGESGRKASAVSQTGPVDHELKSGASAVVVHISNTPKHKVMHVANVGDMLAAVSRSNGTAPPVSQKHDPFEREEIIRIRAAEGWVSPKGMVNDEEDLSRSFGLYHLLPAVNARPHVTEYVLTEQDELVILGNRGLWDYVSLQTAFDIAHMNRSEPMKVAQMLRDRAMSYGSDGNTVVMVIAVGDLFKDSRTRLATGDGSDPYAYNMRPKPRDEGHRYLGMLNREIPPPRGQLALVFTDIRNSTQLWEKTTDMPLAMNVHNELLRRECRTIGGYEVKTEGDAFMVSFESVITALHWCFTVQTKLLTADWPPEILATDEGREIYDKDERLIARGLSVRMGIHWGRPVCALDPLTGRMDYFGPMVNRSSRVSSMAQGGQIMVSGDSLNEINLLMEAEESTLDPHMAYHVEELKRMGVAVHRVGERSLKGLEVPEMLSLVFPQELVGRLEMRHEPAPAATRSQFSVEQLKQLALLTIRLESLSSSRVFRNIADRPAAIASAPELTPPSNPSSPIIYWADPEVLMPNIKQDASEQDLLVLLEALSTRIDNALVSLQLKQLGGFSSILDALKGTANVDQHTLLQALEGVSAAPKPPSARLSRLHV